MAYTNKGYTLFSKDVTLKGGRKQTIYFFSKNLPKDGTPCDLPKGKEVTYAKTGLPILRNKK